MKIINNLDGIVNTNENDLIMIYDEDVVYCKFIVAYGDLPRNHIVK